MLLSPWVLAVTLALVAIAAIPTRRLFVAGVGRSVLTAYLVALVALGFLAASGRAPERLVVPFFVVAFVAPLLVSPALVRRALRRAGRPGKEARPSDAP
ncbi:MAG TPA: hypothetical protein VFC97_01815 [Verrucomicrobiae bacterium]|jgi:hypothetical protein|nr:hypothetical protein [Verrucomicrobiae bacterium]